ncbi:hypothetical protein AB0H71_15035 [Nocardia sp. NPDC050697]|uniref:hypothetical protein n=1 Tax=Nocardia sp. NPDC050697 TaxID=3155158 RepID=UPI0033F4C981
MSSMTTVRYSDDGITARYIPGEVYHYKTSPGSIVIPARIAVELAGVVGGDASLSLSIEDARSLLAALPGVLAEHDAAESARIDTTITVDAGKAA